jgi:hypothetical protein
MATLAELQTRKAAYLEAEARILKSQDYSVGDGVIQRRNRRADLEQVRAEIAAIDAQITALDPSANGAPRRRIYYGVPR